MTTALKLRVGKAAYEQLSAQDRQALVPVECSCVIEAVPSQGCLTCVGTGTAYEFPENSALRQDITAQVEANLSYRSCCGSPKGFTELC